MPGDSWERFVSAVDKEGCSDLEQLHLIESALQETTKRLTEQLDEHLRWTRDEPVQDAATTSAHARGDNATKGWTATELERLLKEDRYDAGLALLLQISSSAWYLQGDRDGRERLEPLRKRLVEYYAKAWWEREKEQAWTDKALLPPAAAAAATATMSPSNLSGTGPLPLRPFHPSLAPLFLISRESEAQESFVKTKCLSLRSRLRRLLLVGGVLNPSSGSTSEDANDAAILDQDLDAWVSAAEEKNDAAQWSIAPNAAVLRAVRELDVSQRMALTELRSDRALLLGKYGAFLTPPTDIEALVSLIHSAYLPILRESMTAAVCRLCGLGKSAALGDGPPVCFFDVEELECDELPEVGEEILVMRWDDAVPLRTGRLRWWCAKVLQVDAQMDRATFMSLTRRRGTLTQLHQGPTLQLKGTNKSIHLRGLFYLRPYHHRADIEHGATGRDGSKSPTVRSPASHSSGCFVLQERVLMLDDGEGDGSYFWEGTVVKQQGKANRYCVQLDGSTSGTFISGESLLKGPGQIEPWRVLRTILRSIHDLPMKVQQSLMPAASASTEPKGPDFDLLLLDQGFGTRMSVAWVASLADTVYDLHKQLLIQISRSFKALTMSLRRESGQVASAEDLIATIKPVFADVAHFLTVCVMGSYGAVVDEQALQLSPTRPRSAKSPATGLLGRKGSMAEDRNIFAQTVAALRTPTAATSRPPATDPPPPHSASAPMRKDSQQDVDKSLRCATGFGAVLNALTLEVQYLHAACKATQTTSAMGAPDIQMLTLACFLRGAWDAMMHRLDMVILRFMLHESVVSAFSVMTRRVSNLLVDLVAATQQRIIVSNVHSLRTHILQDIDTQDWSSDKPLLQDLRCTHGITAWTLLMRGLLFDLRGSLAHHASSSEAREVLSSVLSRSAPAIVTRYLAIQPSRSRFQQYVADVALVLVFSLAISLILKRSDLPDIVTVDSAGPDAEGTALRSGPLEDRRDEHFRDVLPVTCAFESKLTPHDAAHQTTLANLKVVEGQCQILALLLCLLRAPVGLLVEFLHQGHRSQKQQERPQLAALADALCSVSVRQLAHDMEQWLCSPDADFNLITESRKIGAGPDEEGMVSPSDVVGYSMSRKQLTDIDLDWRAILAMRPYTEYGKLLAKRYELIDSPYPPLTDAEGGRRRLIQGALQVSAVHSRVSLAPRDSS